jgi:outer membrane protein OmpA-like peptidoglycan-associated protein/WD40 repeat protein
MKQKNLISLLLLWKIVILYLIFQLGLPFGPALMAQDVKIIDINYANFPDIYVTFLATGANGKKIMDLQKEEVVVDENNEHRAVIKVENPSEQDVPVSVVLVLDVSNSMEGERLELVKDAAASFIRLMPLETSEVAVASFNDNVYLNSDFTQNRDQLLSSLKNLNASMGTSYSTAFLSQNTGILDVARRGKYKKVVVFLTDGLSTAYVDEVVEKAKASNIGIYCISFALPIPGILKDISTLTGGQYYEAVRDPKKVYEIYSSIFQVIQKNKYGTLVWRSGFNCEKNRKVNLTFRGIPAGFSYEVPANQTGILDADVSGLYFGTVNPGSSKTLSFDLLPQNIPFNITKITNAKKEIFSLAGGLSFPIGLEPGTNKQINVSYRPKDAGVFTDRLIISSKECPDKGILLNGGTEEQIRLIAPKGGEVFVVGMDTFVMWDGIKRNRNVAIAYRNGESKPWVPVSVANLLQYKWIIPNDTGSKVQVRLIPVPTEDIDFQMSAQIRGITPSLESFSMNNEGSKIATNDAEGGLKLWDAQSGGLLSSVEGYKSEDVAFDKDNNRLISFSKDDIVVWDFLTSKLMAKFQYNNKIVNSIILPNDDEKWIPCVIRTDKANAIRLWAPHFGASVFFFQNEQVKAAALTPEGSRAMTLNKGNILKLWDTQSNNCIASYTLPKMDFNIIINPNGKTAVINEPSDLVMLDLKDGHELFRIFAKNWEKYSRSGDMFITKPSENTYHFIDTYSGKLLFKLNSPRFFKCSAKGYEMLYYKNDSLVLLNLLKQKERFCIRYSSVKDAVISPDNSKLLVILKDNVVDLYKVDNQEKLTTFSNFEAPVVSAIFSNDGKKVITNVNNNKLIVWSPYIKNGKEVVSGNFSIISPKIDVKDTIFFEDEYLHHSREVRIADFIVNKSKAPVFIDKIVMDSLRSEDFEMVSMLPIKKIAAHSSENVELRFSPKLLGNRKALMRTYTTIDTFTTVLLGKGVIKPFQLLAENIRFGKVKVFESVDTVVPVMSNPGTDTLRVTGVVNNGPNQGQFILPANQANVDILPGGSFALKLSFSPQQRGFISGSLAVRLKHVPDPVIINLTGEGLASRVVCLRGKTLNSLDSLPLSASVCFTDLETSHILQRKETGVKGDFIFMLNADRNYGINASKENYISGSENIDLVHLSQQDTIYRNLYLTGLKPGAMIRMNCIFFDYNKANLLPNSFGDLDLIAGILNDHKELAIEIHGHTDSIGSRSYNLNLSRERAQSVVNYLISKGTSKERLAIKYFGFDEPVATNSTEEGRARNRRVEVKVVR